MSLQSTMSAASSSPAFSPTLARPRTRRVLATLSASVLLAAAASAQGPILPDPQPFPVLDVVGGPWVNLATFPVRPMVFTPSGALWVVNHHDSTIECFDDSDSEPDLVYGVPWSPVAIDYWPGNGGAFGPELLVVCRGTWAVVGINPTTGAPTRLLQLRPGSTLPFGLDARIGRMAEPGDILVDKVNHRAFVSCTGADSVIQIDLLSFQIVRVFNEEVDDGDLNDDGQPDEDVVGTPADEDTDRFRIKSPLFLSFDINGVDVLCAPLHSGNNSLAEPNFPDPNDPELSELVVSYAGATKGLPDEDLFRIRPYVNAGNPGSVQLVLNATGTILFAHGINTGTETKDFWQLNTDALNALPNPQNEHDLQGNFLRNRVSIVRNNGSTWGSVVERKILDPGSSLFDETNTVGQPFALVFDSSGNAYITGLLTDNVVVLDKFGNLDMEWDLPPGSIPRGILQHPSSPNLMLVYCWGLNAVLTYDVNTTSNTATLTLTYSLGYDPTPPAVADGRKMFFDAERSLHKNVSCASCHVEAGNDFLVWNLSNKQLEEKGPMFTQTLVGLQRLAPFHWRGERALVNFNEFAFTGLLGAAAQPSATDFADFEAYVFSLSNPANPNQNRKRLIDAAIHHPDTLFEGTAACPGCPVVTPVHTSGLTGNAIDGLEEFQSPELVNVGRHSCVDCHDFPTGTNNDINTEAPGRTAARRVNQKPAPFHEVWRKRQTLVRVNDPTKIPAERDVPFLGSGFAHSGEFQDLFMFVNTVIDDVTGLDDDQKANDIADFIHQWDQGLGQAAHFAYLIDANNANSATTSAEVATYLGFQRLDGNCDIAVIGMSKNSSGVLVRRRWAFMKLPNAYVCEDPAFANRSFSAFQTGATNGETNIFLGLPPGMAERFAIDYDMDGVRNLDATELGKQYDPTQPGWNNGVTPRFAAGTAPQIVWESTRVARLVFTTNEPTSATIVYDEGKTATHTTYSPIGGDETGAQRRMARFHSVLLTDLRPSTSSIDAESEGSGPDGAPPGYDAESVVYTVTITLKDATNNLTVTTPFTFDTDDFIVAAELEEDPGSINPDELKDARTHVIDEICLGGPECDQITSTIDSWHANVQMKIAFKRGEWQDPAPGSEDGKPYPAKDRVVFGRVMIRRADGTVESAANAGLSVVAVPGNSVLVDTVMVNRVVNPNGTVSGYVPESVPEDPGPHTPLPGKYLAGTALSDANGNVNLLFSVSKSSSNGSPNLGINDNIIFNVEGVIEVRNPTSPSSIDTTTVPGEIHYYSWRGMTQWSFPNTKEKNSSVESMDIPFP